MSYIALYRAYRPKTFDDVAGQEMVVKTLRNAIIHNKIAHAYLFSGPRGTGKTSIAKIFAKAVNCTSPNNGNPDLTCEICEGIEKGNIPDVIEIDAASNNGVDEIRDLRDKVKYMPSLGKYKVYIIDEVHMLSTGAFNALLKTLEEPPKHVIFILATTEIHKIPETILSRCQRFDFKNIEDVDVFKKLTEIINKEKINIEEEAIKSIIKSAEGGLRDAISLLDQAVSFTKDKITEDDISKISGGVSKSEMKNLLQSFSDKNYALSSQTLDILFSEGKEASKIVSDLIIALRDILLEVTLKVEKPYYLEFHNKLSKYKIFEFLDILTNLQNDLKFTNQKRAYIELAFMKMIDHHKIEEIDHLMLINNLKEEVFNLKAQVSDLSRLKTTPTKQIKQENLRQVINISDIQEILNNANKDKRVLLNKGWPHLENYPNAKLSLTANILSKGELVAVSNNMLLVYDDEVMWKNILKEDVKKQVLKIINNKTKHINNFFAILRKDYNILVEQFIKQGNKLNLNHYDFGLYEEIETVKENKDELYQHATSLFGDIVEIKEN